MYMLRYFVVTMICRAQEQQETMFRIVTLSAMSRMSEVGNEKTIDRCIVILSICILNYNCQETFIEIRNTDLKGIKTKATANAQVVAKNKNGKSASKRYVNIVIKNADYSSIYHSNVAVKAKRMRIYYGKNYDGFPIVPLWGNDKKVSELNGRRSTIDAYDIIYSNLVNNVSEGNLLFWLVQNSGGMDDDDLMMFRERIMTTGIASVDDNAGQGISVKSIEAPYNGGISSLEVIKAKLYEDFMALDVSSISSGSKTATEINAAYQPLDNKVDAFEYQLRKFFNGIFKIAGINDKVSFRRSRISNRQEELDMVLQSASYLDDDTITKLICNSLGIPDMYDEIIKNKKEELCCQ